MEGVLRKDKLGVRAIEKEEESVNIAVAVSNIRKEFTSKKKKLFKKAKVEKFVAVDGVSFNIKKGEIFGLLGPNGAGKTTTIKMITGILRPSDGYVHVNGIDVDKEQIKALQNIGTVLAGDRSVYWKLTARENLEYFAALYGMGKKKAKERADKVLKRLGLEEKADIVVEKFSTGMKQKVALGKALIADAPVLLLDEPTLGLDPQAAINLREIIMELKEEGRTVLLTTHYMEEADLLSDRIAIIDNGKIIALDTPENLKKSIGQVKKINIDVDKECKELIDEIKGIEDIENVIGKFNEEENKFQLIIHHVDGQVIIQKILDKIHSNKCKVLSVNVKEPSLEDVFIDLTGKSLRE
ncbi:ABC transporter ATP-binding protein [Oceanirhabdus seepicola]|uniref:ABC transporter ATP-binding protein n=1 Tax=Oceanirhabdus seepicola TaxID=2828781 RepID=UPI002032EAC9|nr:ABC transporter ATP-binding protein [Oceanirhabdus seepicola]